MRIASMPLALEALDQCRLERRAGQPPVIADRDRAAAVARDDRTEAAADGERIVLEQRAADRPADVVLAQRGRIEAVCERHLQTVSCATAVTMKSGVST